MPTRYLKPGIRDSEAIDKLSPLAETLFYRLLVTVDDFGRCDARLPMVKAAAFPIKKAVTEKVCESLLIELLSAGLILIYEAGGKQCIQLQKWDNTPRAKESRFPAHADECAQTYTSVCNPRTLLPLTVTGTGTVEAPKTPAASRGQRLPHGWEPGPEHMAFAESIGFRNGKAAAELEKFRDYWTAQPGMKGVKTDWPATWRNWCRKASEFSSGKPSAAVGNDPFAGAA